MAWIELHQGLREHKKVYACMEILGVSRVTMVGMLATFWLWALDNAQDGVLAGVSNKTIARVCGWNEKKANQFVSALVECGWLDQNGDNLVIHDWYDYAGKLMERREKDLERKRNGKGKHKNSAGIPAEFHGNGCGIPSVTVPIPYQTVPNTVSTHANKHSYSGNSAESACAENDGFSVFWESYPRKIGRDDALEAWNAMQPSQSTVERIMQALDRWVRSEQWADKGGRFIPRAAKFLADGYWMNPPAIAAEKVPKGASGQLGEAEMEAIQRMLSQEVPDGKLPESL